MPYLLILLVGFFGSDVVVCFRYQTKTRRDRVLPMNVYLKRYLVEMKVNFVDPNTDLVLPRDLFLRGCW